LCTRNFQFAREPTTFIDMDGEAPVEVPVVEGEAPVVEGEEAAPAEE
jgi:hypothetical protein